MRSTTRVAPCDVGEPKSRQITPTFDYRSEDDTLLYPIAYFDDGDRKRFEVCRPDGSGGGIEGLKGVRRVLYRLPELIRASTHDPVFIPGSEKHVDHLRSDLQPLRTDWEQGRGALNTRVT